MPRTAATANTVQSGARFERKRLGRGKEREDTAADPWRREEAAGGAGHGEEQALDKQLPEESRAARA